jgi:hypothetical protein
MGVEPAYPVTLSAVTVRTAYFEREQLMCLSNDGGKRANGLGGDPNWYTSARKHDVQQRYIQRSVRGAADLMTLIRWLTTCRGFAGAGPAYRKRVRQLREIPKGRYPNKIAAFLVYRPRMITHRNPKRFRSLALVFQWIAHQGISGPPSGTGVGACVWVAHARLE